MSGQLRVTQNGLVVGLDMGAALQMGAALGLNAFVLAELLPGIEGAMVRKYNEQIAQSRAGETTLGDA